MGRGKTSNVMKRLSTMRYELAMDMNPTPKILSLEETTIRNGILCNDGMCEYCRKTKASGSKGDHFYPMVGDRYPTEYCNDEWNCIPACVTCNSSKGGKNWKTWFESNNKSNPMTYLPEDEKAVILAKFTRYDREMQKYCQRKKVDRAHFDRLMEIIRQAFAKVDDGVKVIEMPIAAPSVFVL